MHQVVVLVERDCPAERSGNPLRHHHPQLHIVLLDGHAALVEVEQHTDAVVWLRPLAPLPVTVAGEMAPVGRLVEAVAVLMGR